MTREMAYVAVDECGDGFELGDCPYEELAELFDCQPQEWVQNGRPVGYVVRGLYVRLFDAPYIRE